MKCSVFIATSADGYIATLDGGVDWLHNSGASDADMSEQEDMGFEQFMASVDCMIMGRKCMEAISSFNLADDDWPYGDIKIYVLSNTLTSPPENLAGKIEVYSGNVSTLLKDLERAGCRHAYVDGGSTITNFLNLKLIDEMIITQAPILLGEGLPLFGKLNHAIKLNDPEVVAFPNDFVQTRYKVSY